MVHRIEPGSLSAFTLFETRKDGKDVWQLSYRKKGNDKLWEIHHVTPETARLFLDMMSGIETPAPKITLLAPQIEAINAGFSYLESMGRNEKAHNQLTLSIERSIDALAQD